MPNTQIVHKVISDYTGACALMCVLLISEQQALTGIHSLNVTGGRCSTPACFSLKSCVCLHAPLRVRVLS